MTALPDELVIAKVEQTSRDLVAALECAAWEDGPVLMLDGSQVRRIDGAGVQLLIACRKAAEARGLTLGIVNYSEELRGALAFIGVAERFGIGAR